MPSRLTATCLIALGLLASCAAPPPPERPPAPSSELTFDAGVDYAIDDLLVQLRRLPAFSAAPGLLKKESDIPRGAIAVDPAIDGNTGQQTLASKALDSRLLQRASDKFAQFDVAAVNSAILGKAQYLLAATLTPIDAAKASATFRISLSLTDIKTGFVVAQSAARVRSEGVDTTPTPFYRDSPSLTKDRVVEGQIRTAQTPTGSAADEFYMSRLPINALISEGSNRYEAGNYAEALRYYETAAARPEGQQLRVLNGLYLANTQLGRTDDAEKAFTKIVALGLATNSLTVKFLFKPGSTQFYNDRKVRAPYNGTVTARFVDPGALIQAATSSATQAVPLFTIMDISTLRFYINVPQEDAPLVKKGTPVTIAISGLPEKTLKATVTRSTVALDPGTRSLLAEIDLPNPGHDLAPGMFAEVVVELRRHPDALVVPPAALVSEGSSKFVFTVEQGVARRIPVATGIDDGLWVEITSGLTGAEDVVVTGKARLSDGVQVKAFPYSLPEGKSASQRF